MTRSDVKKEAYFFFSKMRAEGKSALCRCESRGFVDTIRASLLSIEAIRIKAVTNIYELSPGSKPNTYNTYTVVEKCIPARSRESSNMLFVILNHP